MTSGLGDGRFVDDLPELIARVADRHRADRRHPTQERLAGRVSSTAPRSRRLRRVRAGRFPGCPAARRRRRCSATSAVCRRSLASKPPSVAMPGRGLLLPAGHSSRPRRRGRRFRGSPSIRVHRDRRPCQPTPGDARALAAAREHWRGATAAGVTAVESFGRGYAQWLDAAQAEALLAAGLMVNPQEFSLPSATLEGVKRTQARAQSILAQANSGLETAEHALGERICLAVGALVGGSLPLPDAAELNEEARRQLAALPAFEKTQADDALHAGLRARCLLGNQVDRMATPGSTRDQRRLRRRGVTTPPRALSRGSPFPAPSGTSHPRGGMTRAVTSARPGARSRSSRGNTRGPLPALGKSSIGSKVR
jgi:hypothetical protein